MKYRFLLLMIISALSLSACGSNATVDKNISNTEASSPTENLEMGEEVSYDWIELSDLRTYENIRDAFDKLIGIQVITNMNDEKFDGKKTGLCYIDMNRSYTSNSTLRFSLNQPKFLELLWGTGNAALKDSVRNTFTDAKTDYDVMLAAINAYYNLFEMTATEFGGSNTLTKAQFLTGLYRAHNPVTQLEANIELKLDVYNPFVNQMLKYSFVDMKDEASYTGRMTRGEALYTLVKMYYADELESAGDVNLILDTKDGGDITIEDAVKNPDGGAPSDIYKAVVIAEKHGLIDGAESRWDDTITKAEALDLIVKTYSDKVALSNATNNELGINQGITSNTGSELGSEQFTVSVTGEIKFSQQLKDAINNSLDKHGVPRNYGKNVLDSYVSKVADKDNSKVHYDILDDIVKDLNISINNHQNQNNNSGNNGSNSNTGNTNNGGNTNSNSGSNNNGSGNTKVEIDDDGYIYENDNEYPSGNIYEEDDEYIPPQMEDPTAGVPEEGLNFNDESANKGDDDYSSGELIGNVEINP